MPPKRRATRKAPTRGQRQPEVARGNGVPADYYNDMLSEASTPMATSSGDEGRPLKKRKVTSKAVGPPKTPTKPVASTNTTPQSLQRPAQIVYDDYRTEESDIEFEDVGLGNVLSEEEDHGIELTAADRATDLNIAVSSKLEPTKKRNASQRLPSSLVEKQKRIDIHKIHICCMLSHVYTRNAWCNNEAVQKSLRPLLDKRTVSYLNPSSTDSQFQRSRSLQDGLQQAILAFNTAFRATAKGIRRPQWKTELPPVDTMEPPKYSDPPIDLEKFTRLTRKRQGSRDVGAQLFCALLRSAGLDVRLVCSLQLLSFASVPTTVSSQKQKTTIRVTGSDTETGNSGNESTGSTTSSVIGTGVVPKIPPPIRRFGGAAATPADTDQGHAPVAAKPRTFKESKYPVYWVEVFDEAYQKWLAVDPLVTRTVNKAQKLEPPASDSANDLVYAIAIDEDGCAKDVTRRYAKAYNAKTRRSRIEATKDGQRWLRRTMRMYKGRKQDRDQVEEAELAKKESAEPMPRNVQDFKDHPYYALERYLKHNELIEPKREVGKLSTGKDANTAEVIYRRRDVQIVKSADKWYRTGRELKPNEQPLKYGTARRVNRRNRSPSPVDPNAEDDDEQGLALYAERQTTMYIPKPVVNGSIPKNAFGNLDLYVSSMIPPGSVHIRALETAKAAKILGIDYADAVTGFKFQGRKGTAIVDGAIVATEYQQAVQETILGLRWQAELAEAQKREKEALRMWKKFLVGLRIRERIMGYEVEGEQDDQVVGKEVKDEMDKVEKDESTAKVEAGGFMPDADQGPIAQPTNGKDTKHAEFDVPDFDINNFPDTKFIDSRKAYDAPLVVVLSPWDKGGPLHHLNPHQATQEPKAIPSAQAEPRRKPTLPRTHTPGLFLSPTRDDSQIESGGGFFGDGQPDVDMTTAQNAGAEPADEDLNGLFDEAEEESCAPLAPEATQQEEGVGFLVEDDAPNTEPQNTEMSDAVGDEGGGGFLVADDAPETEMPDTKMSGAIGDEEGGGFLAEDDVPTTEPQEIKMSGAIGGEQPLQDTSKAVNATNGDQSTERAKIDQDEDTAEATETSMLSHDEEDDDAEPDWLVDEIGW